MRIGYPCINLQIPTPNRTFRLASFTEERFLSTVKGNLQALERILEWNLEHDILFFRISSDVIPFASHEICTIRWWEIFRKDLRSIGAFIREHHMRISMHPDQFVLLSSPDRGITSRSVAELVYHARLLDAMGLGKDARIQIHCGGVYGDKDAAIERFCRTYRALPKAVKDRLVIENDDRLYSLADCLRIHAQTGIPVLFDTFHHSCLNDGTPLGEAARLAASTWPREAGPLMIDYSSQEPGKRVGAHAEHIDIKHFRKTMEEIKVPCDVMLEIKDKEKSAVAC